MTDFPLSVARALADSGYISAKEYYNMTSHGEVPATADPVPMPDDDDCWQGPEDAQIAALVAENERLRTALAIISMNALLAPDPHMGGATDSYIVPIEDIEAARAALGEQP